MYEDKKDGVTLEKELKGVLNVIPDIIKVYNKDMTISFFNEAGYRFYNKNSEAVKGKMCYEILDRKEKCTDCPFDEVIKTKQMITRERYIPELNKYMDVCYNPIIDENGEISFIIERLIDITERKILDKSLKDNKEKYKQILNNCSDAIVIIVDNKIVLANTAACNLMGVDYSEIVDSNIYKYFPKKHVKALHKRFRNIMCHKKEKDTYEYEFGFSQGKVTDLQMSCSYIEHEGSPAIFAVIRDISETKQELNKAAEFQRKSLQKSFPAEEFINIESVYVPANVISGDFYHIFKISDDLIIGMLIDVRGKGVSAALNISALDVLLLQEISNTHEPIDIVNNLNMKLVSYYEENYIAVCCFSMDFRKRELKVVGAGINQFAFQKSGETVEEKIVRGAFLGMFEDSEFEQKIIQFETGDKIFFFSDGLNFILDEDGIIKRYMGKVSVFQFKRYIEDFLEDTKLNEGNLKDDCTMIAIEVK